MLRTYTCQLNHYITMCGRVQSPSNSYKETKYVATTCCICFGGKSSLMPFYGLITPKQCSDNLQLMKWSLLIQVPIYIHSWLPMFFPLFNLPSQNNCYIGYPRQTESLYTYQPHHNQLIVVDNKSREEIGGPPTIMMVSAV